MGCPRRLCALLATAALLLQCELGSGSAPEPPSTAAIAAQIAALYEQHAPEKADKVPALLEKYAGAEAALLSSIMEKYGVADAGAPPAAEPSPPSPPPAGGGGGGGGGWGRPPAVEAPAAEGHSQLGRPVIADPRAPADLAAAVSELHTRTLSVADMSGLFGDKALPEFLARWGEAPLHTSGVHPPTAALEFFSGASMHALLAGDRAPKSVYARDGFDFDKDRVPSASASSPPSPFAVYLSGGTVFMNFVERHYPPVAALTCWLAAALGTKAQTNAYLTPPHAQGFTAHTDSQDVLILQLEGTKAWRVYHPRPIPNPFEKHMIRDAGNALRWPEVATLLRKPLPPDHAKGTGEVPEAEAVLGAPLEFMLKPGDVLYVPRGSPHEAFTPASSDSGSLHLTLGLVTESDARYWMMRNQIIALCKQQHAQGISCAGDVGVGMIALKDDPLRGGWLRGAPPFGWATNQTLRAEEFGRIWGHLEAEEVASASAIKQLRNRLEAEVDEKAVVQAEHIEFLAGEMGHCKQMRSVGEALGSTKPGKGKKGGFAGLLACVAIAQKATIEVSEGEGESEGGTGAGDSSYTLTLRAGGGGRKSKKKKVSLPIGNGDSGMKEALEFLARRQRDCPKGVQVSTQRNPLDYHELFLSRCLWCPVWVCGGSAAGGR